MADQKKVLEIVDIRKAYEEGDVLKEISLDIHKGEVVVILGPSGCGKSTLLRCINGLEQYQSGHVKLNGEEISSGSGTEKMKSRFHFTYSGSSSDRSDECTGVNPKWHEVRQKIGMVFQSYDLFPHMTILDNILLGPLKAQKRDKQEVTRQALQLLERVGLLEKKDAYPRQLSGGQKQRVAIVRALCMNPEIMLFDEVTAALDPEMVKEVLDVILELAKQGMTMAIVTHEMKFARAVADRIIFLDEGNIIEEASPQEFFENPKTERAQKFLSIFDFA